MTNPVPHERHDPKPTPAFDAGLSRPRARRAARLILLALLLALACASIWFIDRGAMLTNTQPAPAVPSPAK
jgi:hypothetical protein